jgi:Uma2 family endonuclease
VATTEAKKLITAEEFLKMDLGSGIHELVRGEVIELPMPMPKYGRICFKTGFFLETFGEETGHGYVLSNDSAVLTERGPDTVRGADISYYSHARCPESEIDWKLAPVPPDLVIEVYSPSNRPGEMRAKVHEYLNAGVLMVWVIRPDQRTITIYRQDELTPTVLGEDQFVDNLPELPGFRRRVADFFA